MDELVEQQAVRLVHQSGLIHGHALEMRQWRVLSILRGKQLKPCTTDIYIQNNCAHVGYLRGKWHAGGRQQRVELGGGFPVIDRDLSAKVAKRLT